MHEFLVCSAAYYGTESARQDAVTPSLKTLLGRGLVGGTIFYSTTQTVVPAPLLFFKLKDEIGSGNGDPTLQAGLSYRAYWSQNKVLPHLPPSITYPHGIVRTRGAPAAALHSSWPSWGHGYVFSEQFSQTSP